MRYTTLINEAINTLLKANFIHYASCNCTQGYTEKYRLNGTIWAVHILPHKGTFFIVHNGNAIYGKRIEKFKERFENLIIEIQEEAKNG